MSDKFSIIYSPQAGTDIKEIYSYIAFELLSPNTAEKQVNRIRKAIRSLDFMPARSPLVDWEPWKSMGTHRALVDNFVIFYIVDDAELLVTVIRIVYGGRDLKSIATETVAK